MLNRNYSIFSNQYLYPSGVKFKIDRVEQKEFGTNLYVHLEDYSRKPTDYMFFRHDAPVIEQEIADAADSLHTYFENIEYEISRDLILSLAKLRKFRIQSSLDSLSQVTDEAIKNAKLESLIYSYLMLEIFTFIDTEENWKKARREISLQLQSLDIGDAAFLATGQDDGDIMDDTLEAKEDFYSRVIQLYTRDVTLTNSIYNNKFYSALNRSLLMHGCNDSFISGEDLALAAYGVLLNSILMYWRYLLPTNKPTYRAMKLTEQQLESYSAGCTFTWISFSSSSLCKERAKTFGKCIFVINNACTNRCKYSPKSIMDHSIYVNEQEYLYPSGAKFRIDYIQNKDGYTFFYVHLEDY